MDEDESRLENLKGLPQQGQMMIATPEAASTWAKSIQSLPQHVFKIALNVIHDILPHNANLHLWKKCSSSSCPLGHQPGQNLIHVLNNCKVALDLQWYTKEEACDYFTEVYHAGSRNFVQPALSKHLHPQHLKLIEFDSEEIVVKISRATKCSKSSSSPSPFDRISYLILKRCTSLLTALQDLFN